MTEENWIKQGFQHVKEELKRMNAWLGKNDTKLDNHITHIEHRITAIETNMQNVAKKEDVKELETNMKNLLKLLGIILTAVLSIFGMILVIMVS